MAFALLVAREALLATDHEGVTLHGDSDVLDLGGRQLEAHVLAGGRGRSVRLRRTTWPRCVPPVATAHRRSATNPPCGIARPCFASPSAVRTSRRNARTRSNQLPPVTLTSVKSRI